VYDEVAGRKPVAQRDPELSRKQEERTPSLPQKGGNGHVAFTVEDPQGYQVVLDLNAWEKHIVANHPEMRDLLDLLASTIEQPELIQRSSVSIETHYYYRLTGRSVLRRDDIYVNAVVHRDENSRTGFVKTAFLVQRVRREGDCIWMKRS
jgi:hypothetical protein